MVPNIQKNSTGGAPSPALIPAGLVENNLERPDNSTGAKKTSKKHCRSQSWPERSPIEPHFNVGLIIDSTHIKDTHVSAINKPASRCQLTSLVVLNPCTTDKRIATKPTKGVLSIEDSVGKWLVANKVVGGIEHLDFVGTGQEGCDEMLRSGSIHAVYIVVPPSSQKQYILQALNCKKHVLAIDPTSVKLPEFMEELECAKKNRKFIQTTAMFVHQYRVQRFMNHVLEDDKFGRIIEVNASIQLCCDDVERVGVKLPLRKQDGCIRVLGRFCVLVSTLFYNRVGSYADSARVKSFRYGPNGEVASAHCVVNFTNDRKLNFYVAYTKNATRQAIELKATSRYATMNDFVIEHPDGLATYRVYDRKARCEGNMHALDCDSIDVGKGMGEDRVLWRSFVKLGHQIDNNEGWDDNNAIAECIELTDVALQMKKILNALMESLENGGKEVSVETFCE